MTGIVSAAAILADIARHGPEEIDTDAPSAVEYWTVTTAARYLGVHRESVRRYIDNGRLPAVRTTTGRFAIDAEHVRHFRPLAGAA